MNLRLISALTLSLALATTACAHKDSDSSSITSPSTTPATAVTKAQSISEGGLLQAKSASSYVVNASHGQALSQVSGKTTNGYTVRFNIQGQLTQ